MTKENRSEFIRKKLFELVLKELVKPSLSKRKLRRNFPEWVKDAILIIQQKKCGNCGRFLDVWEFDHIDGNPYNNHITNCQALCPICHAKKTLKKL